MEGEERTYDIGISPSLPYWFGSSSVISTHQSQILVSLFLFLGLDEAFCDKMVSQLIIVPGGIDIVLWFVELSSDVPGSSSSIATETPTCLISGIAIDCCRSSRAERRSGSWDGRGSVCVRFILSFCEDEETFSRTRRFDDALLEEEFAKAGVRPSVEGGGFQVVEWFLSVVVLIWTWIQIRWSE
jgi:hypothetical protein